MGDILSLVEKAESAVREDEASAMAKRMMEAKFDFNDFLSQYRMVAKMGTMGQVMKMLPGALLTMSCDTGLVAGCVSMTWSLLLMLRQQCTLCCHIIEQAQETLLGAGMNQVTDKQMAAAEKSFKQFEAMINSMTPKERSDPDLLVKVGVPASPSSQANTQRAYSADCNGGPHLVRTLWSLSCCGELGPAQLPATAAGHEAPLPDLMCVRSLLAWLGFWSPRRGLLSMESCISCCYCIGLPGRVGTAVKSCAEKRPVTSGGSRGSTWQ